MCFRYLSRFLWLLSILVGPLVGSGQDYFRSDEGTIHFISDAPLEVIEAQSNKMTGILNPTDLTFAFSVPIRSFQGFNSPLQQGHFNENYMESDQYPNATYAGRIIETIDLSEPGTYSIRTKGTLTIHGIERERIIRSQITNRDDTLYIESKFTVPLEDHGITIPRIVHQKIAEEINVTVTARLSK